MSVETAKVAVSARWAFGRIIYEPRNAFAKWLVEFGSGTSRTSLTERDLKSLRGFGVEVRQVGEVQYPEHMRRRSKRAAAS